MIKLHFRPRSPAVASESAQPASSSAFRHLISISFFWTAWIALLACEALALSLAVDTNVPIIANHPAWIVRLLAGSSSLLRFGMCVGTVSAAAILFSPRFRNDLRAIVQDGPLLHRFRGWVACHLAAYAIFFWMTKWLVAGITQPGHPSLRVLAWIGCGLVVAISWCLAAMPPRLWFQLLHRGWPVLLAGSVVGLVALRSGSSTGQLWDSLHNLTFQSTESVLRLFSNHVVCQPDAYRLGIGDFVVAIAPVCSGFEGIGLIWAFLAAYLWLFRKSSDFPRPCY